MSFKRNPKDKFGLSPLDKYLLCMERKKPENISLSLKKFGEKFPRSDGKPRPVPTLSKLFKTINSILEAGPPPSDNITSIMQKASRHKMSNQKPEDDSAGSTNTTLVESERIRLRKVTVIYTPPNIFNCDDTSWKYV